MKGRRTVLGALAAFVVASSFVVVPAAFADPDDGAKTNGEHITYVFCHRTGSDKPFVLVGSDDAAWDEAHQGSVDPPATNPAHPPLNGFDDFLLDSGVGIKKQDYSVEDCVKK